MWAPDLTLRHPTRPRQSPQSIVWSQPKYLNSILSKKCPQPIRWLCFKISLSRMVCCSIKEFLGTFREMYFSMCPAVYNVFGNYGNSIFFTAIQPSGSRKGFLGPSKSIHVGINFLRILLVIVTDNWSVLVDFCGFLFSVFNSYWLLSEIWGRST